MVGNNDVTLIGKTKAWPMHVKIQPSILPVNNQRNNVKPIPDITKKNNVNENQPH